MSLFSKASLFVTATIVVFLIASTYTSYSQDKGFSTIDSDKMFQNELSSAASSQKLMKADAMPVGNVVVPEKYYIGPGDVLAIQDMSQLNTSNPIVVTPDISVMIPRIGILSLKGKTLAESTELIKSTITDKNPAAEVYITLYKARVVMIKIRGNVRLPGIYNCPASYRVSTALQLSNQEKNTTQTAMQQMPALLKQQEEIQDSERMFAGSGLSGTIDYASRNILVHHRDGTSEIVDVEKGSVSETHDGDIYVREGDEIYIPYEANNYPVISISGQVYRPAVFPFKKGDKASMLLKLGLALTENADLNNVNLVLSLDRPKIQLKIDENMNIIGEDYDLLPGSSLIVGKSKVEKTVSFGKVSVTGEVGSPGVYIIKPGVTRVKEIIAMAGGMTDKAYLPLAYVMRREDNSLSSFNSKQEYFKKLQYSNLTLDDSTRFNIDVQIKKPWVSCDFRKLYGNVEAESNQNNVVLLDNDMIVLPSGPGYVYIFGQVNQPGYIPFVKNKTMDWYIEQAGGYTEAAKQDRARIIRGKTQVWINGEDGAFVFDGDEIYVPRPVDIPPGIEVQTWGVIAGILGSTAILINVLMTVFSK